MRFIFSFIAITISIFVISACSTANSDLIVAEFGNNQIKMADFEKAYIKSVGNLEEAKNDSLQQLESYLDLYLNYRMKLRDAEIRGYDKEEAVISELEEYKKQIGKTFIEERYVNEPWIRRLYDDDKFEYEFRHILIKPDTISRQQAYEFALSLIDRINKGEDFTELAKKYSGDPSTKDIGGVVYYLKMSQMPLPNFYDAIVNCPVGKVYQKPVLSTAGYHVIGVVNKKPVRYNISASHIMRDYLNGEGQIDSIDALNVITEAKRLLDQGVSFDSVAAKYSEDPGSKDRGGQLGTFPRRSMVVAFDSVAFNLAVGEISDIVKTRFGYHIVKCTGEEPIPPFETIETELRDFFLKKHQAHRFKQYMDELKKQYGLEIINDIYPVIQSHFDSTKLSFDYYDSDMRKMIKDETAFSLQDKKYNVDDVLVYNIEKGKYGGSVIDSNLVKRLVGEMAENLVIEAKMSEMEKNDPEYADILEEYKSGILIFKLQEEEVWSKIEVDSVGMYNYYQNHKDEFTWGPRVSYKVIISSSDSLITHFRDQVDKGMDFEEIFEKLSKNPEIGLETRIVEMEDVDKDLFSLTANGLGEVGRISYPFRTPDRKKAFIKLSGKYPAAQKTFEEAKNDVAGPYQESLTKTAEQNYINHLDSIYKPVKHYEVLKHAFNEN